MRRFVGSLFIVTALLLVATAPAYASRMGDVDESGFSREYRLKAAFVQRLLSFVTWPAAKEEATGDKGVFILRVVGDGPMRAALENLPNKSVGDRELVIIGEDSPEVLAHECHAIFVSAVIDGQPRSAHPVWGDLSFTAGDHVLTIGEDADFNADGGVLEFYNLHDKLRFAISRGAAAEAGLTVGSKIMRLATVRD